MTISLSGITKKYLLKTALSDITVSFDSGKIHALLGENGAGKSTLAGILSGDIQLTSGKIILDGEEVLFRSTKDALTRGIILVHQRPLLAESITAKENIVLGIGNQNAFSTSLPHSVALQLTQLQKQWAPELNLNAPVRDIGGDGRFYTSLLCALLRNPRCLILDEPSALLGAEQRKSLYTSLKLLASQGCNIIVITHNTTEARQYADTVTILQKGRCAAQYDSPQAYVQSPDANSHLVTGNANNERPSLPSVHVKTNIHCLALVHVSSTPKNKPVLLDASLTVDFHAISIVTGMQEGALGTLEDVVTGMSQSPCSGTILFFDNKSKQTIQHDLHRTKFTSSFLRHHKTAIIPSDRTMRASNPALTVEQMLTVYCTGSSKTVRNLALSLIAKAAVSIEPDERSSSLSGGMLQRLILERELSIDPDALILCEPMQGLDIEAQSTLCARLVSLAAQGKAILILGATDFPLTICDKVYSLEGGTTALCFEHDEEARP